MIFSRVSTPVDTTFHCMRFDHIDPGSGAPAIVGCHEDHLRALAEPVAPTESCFGFDAHVARVIDDWIDDYVAALEEPLS